MVEAFNLQLATLCIYYQGSNSYEFSGKLWRNVPSLLSCLSSTSDNMPELYWNICMQKNKWEQSVTHITIHFGAHK